MTNYVLTGTPGAGKTAVLGVLRERGFATVAEAATDVIAVAHARGVAEPWLEPWFVDRIVAVQRARQQAAGSGAGVHVFDRSPVCTLALSRYLGFPPSPALLAELHRIERDGVYARRVFFVRPLGFVTPTAARQISYADSLAFERVHVRAYRELGYELVDVPAAALAERADLIAALLV